MSELRLHPDHLADLRKSGLSDETIGMMGVYSARPADIPKLVGWDPKEVESALVFPYFGLDGKPNGFHRLKVFPPYKDKDGHDVRYLQKKGSSAHLYILPNVGKILGDPTIPFLLAEGEKKTAKAVQHGMMAIGIGGLWNWVEKGTSKGIEDFDRAALNGRGVVVVPDSDVWSEPNAEKRTKLQCAVFALGKDLERRGAQVTFLVLPQESEDEDGPR